MSLDHHGGSQRPTSRGTGAAGAASHWQGIGRRSYRFDTWLTATFAEASETGMSVEFRSVRDDPGAAAGTLIVEAEGASVLDNRS